eukprot:CAMPEP_0176418432 /NCGR_PEP_ID=MMETSP0127-20121128/7460_1 /TAXON_ID=938130 /ORGANISM="Platyophrya macrostoma, Strain WH" /LENGTH=134 /DNA_ID=CAMNT_0017798741 /DNA_START=64 /DNA_END=468 /DNA_ORIENTATION=+
MGYFIVANAKQAIRTPPKIQNNVYTLEDLAQHDGKKGDKVYIAVKNTVFDVSASGAYKPGGSYSVLAGKDCSVALAKNSLDEKYMNVFNSTKLEPSEQEKMEGWFIFMKKKYPIMGTIKDTSSKGVSKESKKDQ